MRRLMRFLPVMLFLVPTSVWAKTQLSVSQFEDKTEMAPCVKPRSGSPQLETALQSELIKALMQLERFEIKEREIRPVKPKIKLKGMVREFANCQMRGEKGQEVSIAIDVAVINSKGDMTHMFTSSAKVSNTANGKAAPHAIKLVVEEIARRLDNTLPGLKNMRLPLRKGASVANNDYEVQLIKKRSNQVPLPGANPRR